MPGARVLDVGAGRSPMLAPDQRPDGCHYVGLDVSGAELERAGPGAYDERVVGDIAEHSPDLDGRFDLVLSWQVLEHVRPLDAALANMRAYLRPGGRLVAQLSGRYSAFAIVARLLPHRLGGFAMRQLLGVDPDTKFPTHYDRCHHSALRRLLRDWSEVEILPRYRGAAYFAFWGPTQRAYRAYEAWAERGRRSNLATHYLLCAVR